MKTWQCVLLSISVHGVIFGMPIALMVPPDLHTEEIRLLVVESPPLDISKEKTIEPVAAPKLFEPSERPVPPVQQSKRNPPPLRKKPVPKPVSVASVPKIQPDSDTSTGNRPETITEIPETDSSPAESAPSDDLPVRSGTRTASAHEHAVESTVGAMGGPQFIQRSVPRYPRLAQRLGLEGSVLLRLAIDASGKMTGVEVINGSGNGFDEEAVQAVKRSTFAPAVQAGRPVKCLALLKIRFQLTSE